jgi:hypothetical protein
VLIIVKGLKANVKGNIKGVKIFKVVALLY